MAHGRKKAALRAIGLFGADARAFELLFARLLFAHIPNHRDDLDAVFLRVFAGCRIGAQIGPDKTGFGEIAT